MRFGLKEIFVILSISALSIASLIKPNQIVEIGFFIFVLLLIVVSTVLAIFSQHRKAFLISFAITSSVYLGFSHVPDTDGHSPRQCSLEVTTKLLRFGYEKLATSIKGWDDQFYAATETRQINSSGKNTSNEFDNPFKDETISSDPFSDQMKMAEEESFASIKTIIEPHISHQVDVDLQNITGFKPYMLSEKRFQRFMRIGHCIWAVILGWSVGYLSECFARGRCNRPGKVNTPIKGK